MHFSVSRNRRSSAAAKEVVESRLAATGRLGIVVLLFGVVGGSIGGCTSPGTPASRTVQVSIPPPGPSEKEPDARQAATEHFYKGKGLALAGDKDCARLEFSEAIEGFRQRARPGNPEDLEFASQLFDSIKLYRAATEGQAQTAERPPAEDSRDSLIAAAPAARPEEVETAKREVSAARRETAFDIPMVVNDRVLKAVAFYQFRTPQAFAAALQRSGRYMKMMRGILREQGLPADLVYVAMVESAFKSVAHSRKAAHGFWQFIGETGRRYGLRKTRAVDERSDPVKSTLAAARYFHDLYEMFGDWHLAMAAYDTGEGRILRGLQRTGARDYWELSSTNVLMRETRDYVPFILAAALISNDPSRYGFDVLPDPPLEFDIVIVRKPLDLASVAQAIGSTVEELRLLNGELNSRSTPHGVAEYPLRVPVGTASRLSAAASSLPAAREIQERRISVRRGDTVARVAARHRVSVSDLCEWNDLTRTARLKKGMVLVIAESGRPRTSRRGRAEKTDSSASAADAGVEAGISPPLQNDSRSRRTHGEIRALPTPGSAITSAAELGPIETRAVSPATTRSLPDRVDIPAEGFETLSAPKRRGTSVATNGPRRGAERSGSSETHSDKKIVYTVQRGDTLFHIAQQHGLTVEAIRRLNGIRRREALAAGRRLTLVLAATR